MKIMEVDLVLIVELNQMFEMKYETTPQELDEFKRWAFEEDSSFFIKHRSKPPFNKINPWIRRVDMAHEDVRQLLQGKKVDIEVETDKAQRPANLEENKVLIDKIMKECSDFFKVKGYNKDILQYPNIQVGDHKSTKISKAISKFYQSDAYSFDKRDIVQRLISLLGDMWNKYKTQKRKGIVTISTNPKGFILIGHYGPDKESCFREGSTSPNDKWVFSQTPNTVVLTYAEQNEDGKWKNISRSMGVVNPDNKSLHLSNCYFAKGVREGDLIDVYRVAWEKVTGSKSYYVEGRLKFCRDRDKIYANEFGRWSFVQNPDSAKCLKVNKPQANLYGLYTHSCAKTGRTFKDDRHFSFIDSMYCSADANDLAVECVVTGKRTFHTINMRQVLGPDGEMVYVHKDHYNDLPVCEETHQTCSSVCVTPEGKKISEFLFNERYEQCDSTDEFFLKDEMVDLLGYSVSQYSIDQSIFPFDEEEIEQINMVAQKMKESNHASTNK